MLTSDRLVGYLATPFELDAAFEDGDPPITGGAFRLPVRTLTSGVLIRDQELHSAPFLDAGSHPEITFVLSGTRDVRLIEGGDSLHFGLTLVGELGVKGAAISLEVPAELRFLPDSARTLYRWPGDLLLLEGRFSVRPTEHGWQPPQPYYTDFVADTLEVELFVLFVEISPERTLDPQVSQRAYIDIARFQTTLVDKAEPAAAYALGRQAVKAFEDDAVALYRLATLALLGSVAPPCAIFCTPPVSGSVPFARDLAFAEEAARRANQVAKGQDPLVLDTLARIQAEKGDLVGAISLLEQALALEVPIRPPQERAIQQALQVYRALMASRSTSTEPD